MGGFSCVWRRWVVVIFLDLAAPVRGFGECVVLGSRRDFRRVYLGAASVGEGLFFVCAFRGLLFLARRGQRREDGFAFHFLYVQLIRVAQ